MLGDVGDIVGSIYGGLFMDIVDMVLIMLLVCLLVFWFKLIVFELVYFWDVGVVCLL